MTTGLTTEQETLELCQKLHQLSGVKLMQHDRAFCKRLVNLSRVFTKAEQNEIERLHYHYVERKKVKNSDDEYLKKLEDELPF